MNLSRLAIAIIAVLLSSVPCPATCDETAADAVRPAELQIIGEIEPIAVLPERVVYDARIDTGATTSSIDAREIQVFERDGKKWVRFTVIGRDDQKPLVMERPMQGKVMVKRKGAESQERPLVKLTIGMGKTKLERDFTLTDRSAFDFTILIGRNVLAGIALVDVTKSHTLKGALIPEKPSLGVKPSTEKERSPSTLETSNSTSNAPSEDKAAPSATLSAQKDAA